MTFLRFGLVALTAATALSALPAGADFKDNRAINYTVDGGTATGYFKVMAEAINGIVREAYPGSAATYKPGSPAGGILNIAKGQSDLSFTGGAPEIIYALEGKAPYTESLKGKISFVMMTHNKLVAHNLATKDWADRNGVASFADIAAKKSQMRLSVNTRGNLQSTLGINVAIFDAYGVKEEELTKEAAILHSNTSGGLEALRDGKIDVLINGSFLPTAEVADIARNRPLVWISGDPAKMKQAADRWGYETFTVPKGAYPFVNKEEITLTLWNVVVAGAHVSEETVYKLLRAMAENLNRVRSIHPSLAQWSVESGARNLTALPYHPGAARFYREAGVLK